MADPQIQGLPEGATAEPISQTPHIEGLPDGATAEPIATPTSSGVSAPPQSELSRAIAAPGQEIHNTIQGIGQTGSDVGKAAQGGTDSTVRNIAGKINPVAVVAYDKAKQLAGQVGDAFHAGAQEDSIPGKILGTAEKLPMVGDIVQEFEQGHPASAVTRGVTRAALLKAPIPEAEGPSALPKTQPIAGTEMPLTVGQSMAEVNPGGTAPFVKGIEDFSKQLPGSGKLKEIAAGQQAGAREVLANKAATTGAEVSKAPENIEQNFSNAAEQARQKGTAKYQAIAQAADKADLSEPTSVAASVLSDPEVSKILPKSTRDALGKVAQGMTERESVARQIYGKGFGDLEDSQQAEVGKAMQGAPEPGGMQAILKARSELSGAANGTKDANTARLLHGATSQFDDAIDSALQAHDKASGTNLASDLKDAKQLWSQKYAFETFRDGLQNIMEAVPQKGERAINGAKFQQFVNSLDPAGGGESSPLHRMFPGDAKSVQDIHDLADFMGKNQAHAGGMSGAMAKMRVMGLAPSAASLIMNNVGFAWALSKPGVASALKGALSAGKDAAKMSAAIGTLNHLASSLDTQASNASPASNTVSDNLTTKPSATTNNAPPSNSPANVSTITPPPNNATTQNKWVARAIDSAKLKNTVKPQGSGQDVQSTVTSGPPKTLWDGKEGKTLTLKNPSSGKSEKWKLRNGSPILAE